MAAKKQRKGVRAKKEAPVATPEQEATAPAEAVAEAPVAREEPAAEMAPENVVITSVELGTVTITPRVQEFLCRVCNAASPDNPLTPEQAVADILDEWVNIYEHTEDGGIEAAIQAVMEAEPEPDDPEVLDALEEQFRS